LINAAEARLVLDLHRANSSVGATSVSSDELKGVFLATKSSLSDGSIRRGVRIVEPPSVARNRD
jgi:hypothetical protein